jgi:hypothetical protein
MARWRKIDTRIWADERFRALDDRGKLLFLCILTHPNMTVLGAMRHTIPGIAMELGWSAEAIQGAFADLVGTEENPGPLIVNEGAHLVALRHWFKYNKPEYPKGLEKLWKGALDLIPECPEKYQIITRSIECLDSCSDKMKKAMGGGLRKAMVDSMKGIPDATPDESATLEREGEREGERDNLTIPFAFANGPIGTPPQESGQQEGRPTEAKKPRKRNGSNGHSLENDEPLPFSIPVAMNSLRERCQRFVPPADFGSRHGRIVSDLIRAFPDMRTWERVGDWLAAGGAAYMSFIGVDALKKHFGTFVTASQDWENSGRQPVGKRSPGPARGMRWGAA